MGKGGMAVPRDRRPLYVPPASQPLPFGKSRTTRCSSSPFGTESATRDSIGCSCGRAIAATIRGVVPETASEG